MSGLLCWAIVGYRRFVSPLLAGHCRYDPTCSEYALGCIRRHGSVRGVAMGVARLARCHPWGGSGWDPVPERRVT